MNQYYTASDWLREAASLEQTLTQQLAELRRRRKQHAAAQEELTVRRDTAFTELLAAILPELSRPALERAVALTGYAALTQQDPQAALTAERQRAEAALRAVEADPAWVNRVDLRDPVTGSLTRALAEEQEHLTPLDAFLDRARHPRLEALIANGYGTPDYSVEWWRLSYYADWQAGDEIVEQFPEKGWERFEELRAHYEQVKEAADRLRARCQELQAEIDRGLALEAQREALLADLQGGLERRHLQTARHRLGRFLDACGPEAVGERLAQDPEIELLAKAWAGLRKQAFYMAQLRVHKLDEPEGSLEKELAKLRRKQLKYRRPKHAYTRFSASDFQRQFKDRRPRFQKHWKRYDRAYSSVWRFDRYDRGALRDDFLWWDLMTDGRVRGDFIPEVHRFHQAHPSYRYERPGGDDDEALAAAAVAGADLAGLDEGLGAFDAS